MRILGFLLMSAVTIRSANAHSEILQAREVGTHFFELLHSGWHFFSHISNATFGTEVGTALILCLGIGLVMFKLGKSEQTR